MFTVRENSEKIKMFSEVNKEPFNTSECYTSSTEA